MITRRLLQLIAWIIIIHLAIMLNSCHTAQGAEAVLIHTDRYDINGGYMRANASMLGVCVVPEKFPMSTYPGKLPIVEYSDGSRDNGRRLLSGKAEYSDFMRVITRP